jgi:hypothetical protein
MEVTGEIEAGEAQGAASSIVARLRGSNQSYYAVLLGLMGAGGVVGYAIGCALTASYQPNYMLVIGLGAGWVLYRSYCRPLLVRRFRKNMADRGLDTRFYQTITMNHDAIELSSGPVRSTAQWSAVTEIFKSKGYWIFLGSVDEVPHP